MFHDDSGRNAWYSHSHDASPSLDAPKYWIHDIERTQTNRGQGVLPGSPRQIPHSHFSPETLKIKNILSSCAKGSNNPKP